MQRIKRITEKDGEGKMSWVDVGQIAVACIASAGGIGAIIIGVVKFSANRIADRMNAKFEATINKELEKYKANIDNKLYISKARFDREFSMYQDLCEKNITMVYDMGAAVMITRGAQYPNTKSVNDFVILAAQHINDADILNKRYAPFIAKEIFESYKELGKQALNIISLLDLWNKFEIGGYQTIKYNGIIYTKSKTKDEIEDKQKKLSRLSDDILDKMRNYLSSLDTLGE